MSDGIENDTAYLLMQKWKGAWIEGNEGSVAEISHKLDKPIQKGHLKILHAFITRENIISHFKALGVPQDCDFLAIDIDGNDFWIWKELYH